ncbi:MAG: hypothetical protein E7205_10395 [Tissierellaceae bacterium]|jgi:hypothetical protein|nr:hypothetical protein [Tissierellaceae bacterium]
MEKKDYSFGIILIAIGIMFLLLNLNVLSFSWIIFITSLFFIILYFYRKQMGYMTIGLILLAVSLVSLINEYIFDTVNIKGFVYLWILGIISLIMYKKYSTKGYLIFGCILPVIGTYSLIEELVYGDISWIFFLLLAVSFYVIYIVGYKRIGESWARNLSAIFVILSLLFLLSSKNVIKYGFWKVISYLWPILLVIIGVRIIYNMKKINRY